MGIKKIFRIGYDVVVNGLISRKDSSEPLIDTDSVLGGAKNVSDLTARDAISASLREEGMQVYVISETATYQLQGGITNSDWVLQSSGSGGEANTGANVGGGLGVFAQKSGVSLEFKSLVEGTNVTLSEDEDEITINASGESGSVPIHTETFTNSDLVSSVLTFTHILNTLTPMSVIIFDDTNKEYNAVNYEYESLTTSSAQVTIETDPISGTWTLLVVSDQVSVADVMPKTVYDPTNVQDDAFDMGNMVETATAMVLTDVERTKLEALTEPKTFTFVSGDLVGGVLSINHELDNQWPSVMQVYDDSNKLVVQSNYEYEGVDADNGNLTPSFPVIGTCRIILNN